MKIIRKFHPLEIMQKMHRAKYVGIDTEFVKDKHYKASLSLVQFYFGGDEVFILDAIEESCIVKEVVDIIMNNDKLKIFHSCKMDFEALSEFIKHDYEVISVRDVQCMSSMIKDFSRQESYKNLVYKMLDHKIDKSVSYKVWGNRPLTDKMINYAAQDVFYLIDLYKTITKILNANQYEIAMQKALSSTRKGLNVSHLEKDFRRIIGVYFWKYIDDLYFEDMLKKAILQRDKKAREVNIMPKYIESDLDLAKKLVSQIGLSCYQICEHE